MPFRIGSVHMNLKNGNVKKGAFQQQKLPKNS